MSRKESTGQAAVTSEQGTGTPGPRWRALLEDRWQAHVQEVTELSLAYHVAAAAVSDDIGDGAGQPEIASLLRRAVEARRKLADVEDALGRLAAGNFGRCEQCGSAIPAGLLTAAPETRYCPRCDAPSPDPEAGQSGVSGISGVRPLAGRATR
jgi:RNA polymerase-binding transcription factor DksA